MTDKITATSLNNLMEQLSKEQAQERFESRLDKAKTTTEAHTQVGIKTLKAVFKTCDAVVSGYTLGQLAVRRKNPFYINVLQPAMEVYNEALLAAEADKTLKWKVPSCPAKILTFIIAETLTQKILGDGIKLTLIARQIVNKAIFALDVVAVDVRTDAGVLGGALALVRTIIEQHDTLLVAQSPDSTWLVTYTDEEKEILNALNEQLIERQVTYVPMIVKPKRHTNLVSGFGGYNTIHSPLLKTPYRTEEGNIPAPIAAFNATNNKAFFDTINHLQEVAYCVDDFMLDYIDHIQDLGICVSGLEWSLPIEQAKAEKEAEAQIVITEAEYEAKGYKLTESKRNTIVKNAIASATSKVQACTATLSRAEEYAKLPEFYFPIFLDRRGRAYPYVSGGLSYQGNTLGKSLIEFKETVEVDAVGRDALWFTLGSLMGGDKLVLEKRIAFGKSFKELVWAFMEDGSDDLLYESIRLDPDHTLLTMKFAKECYSAETIDHYRSGILVPLDSSSSAIQIGGLLQKCHQCSEGTNIINVDESSTNVADAYATVSTPARNKLQKLIERRGLTRL